MGLIWTEINEATPKAEVLIIYKLKNYKFIIIGCGVATVVPYRGSSVEGVLWGLSSECKEALDRSEGVSKGIYRNEFIPIFKGLNALIYFAADDIPGSPRENYLEGIIKTANALYFSKSYIDYLNSFLEPRN
jgi:AIG2-like family